MLAAAATRQEFSGGGPQAFAAGNCVDWGLQIDQARDDASDIGINNWDCLVESKGRHRVCGIAANSGQAPDGPQVPRENAPVFVHDSERGGAEITGAAVIAESLPGMEDVMFGRGGQRSEAREPAEP